jgi:hypothetical protein
MQFDQLGRREFIALIGGAVATWPLATRAQQPAMTVAALFGGDGSDVLTPYVRVSPQKGGMR